MARRIGNILSAKKSKSGSDSSNASISAIGDNATQYSADGEKSVAMTVSSQKTVKVSNRKPEKPDQDSGKWVKSKSAWMSLKRLVGNAPDATHRRTHSKSVDFELKSKTKSSSAIWSSNSQRRRVLSEDGANQQRQREPQSVLSARVTSHLDLAIKGRLDGVDILSLGPARMSTLMRRPDVMETRRQEMFDPLRFSFVGASYTKQAAELVTDMIWSSGGKMSPELVLEGYLPGGGDRWAVKLGNENGKENPNKLQPRGISKDDDDSTAELTEDGSTNMPSHKLWNHIWGDEATPPAPTHMKSGKSSSEDEDEDVMKLAAVCSIPVDLDEDAFIINSPEHFRSIHDVAMVPLQARRFGAALKVLEKLMRGLEEQNNARFEHLKACTQHNIGIILMFESKFEEASEKFHRAVTIRAGCLSQLHPDVAVSLMRRGEAQFALGNFKDALNSFEAALAMSPTEDTTRAKMLNNIGVVHYQQDNFADALKAFTSALEIQRQWLDGAVRRESIVYDASITLGNMGKIFLELSENEVAYSVYEEACLVRRISFVFTSILEAFV